MKLIGKATAILISLAILFSAVCLAEAETAIQLDPDVTTLTYEQSMNHDLENNPYKIKLGFKLYKVNTSDGSYELLPDTDASNKTNDVVVKPGDVIRVEVWAQTNFHTYGVQFTPAYHNAWLKPTTQSYETYEMKASTVAYRVSAEDGMPSVENFDESYGKGNGTFERPIYANETLYVAKAQTNHTAYMALKKALPTEWRGSGINVSNWYNTSNPDILDENGKFKYNVYQFSASMGITDKPYTAHSAVLNVYQPITTFNLTVDNEATGSAAVFIPVESIVTVNKTGGNTVFSALADPRESMYFEEEAPQAVVSTGCSTYKGYCMYGDDTETKYDMVWDITNATINIDVENTDENLADLSTLCSAFVQADIADTADCTSASLNRFNAAFSAAKAILAQQSADVTRQAEIDAVTAELQAATAGLTKLNYCDYTFLDEEIKAYELNLGNSSNYTVQSWTDYTAKYNDAKQLKKTLFNDEAGENQKIVDDAASALRDARLELKDNRSGITGVSYDAKGIYSVASIAYEFTINGAASKIQVLSPDGGTMTFDRRSSKVKVVSYNEAGEVVDAKTCAPSYEIWSVNLAVAAGDYKVRAKYDYLWDNVYFNFAVKYDEYQAEAKSFLASVGGNDYSDVVSAKSGEVITFKAVTPDTAIKVQFVFADGGTSTYTTSKAVDNGDGTLTWTITRTFSKSQEIDVKVKAPTGWATEFSGHVSVTIG